MDSHILTTHGWTSYEPPEHEGQAKLLAGILDGYSEDCRRFAKLARTARFDNLHHKFGLSWDDFCTTWLRTSSDVVEAVIKGVEVLGEEMPIPLELAHSVGREYLGHGGDRRSKEFQGYYNNLEKSVRGTTNRYILNRLRQKRPDLAEAYQRGEYPSVRATAIAAGWVKDATALDEMRRAWHKATDEEKRRFVREVVTSESDRQQLAQELVAIETRATSLPCPTT